MSIASARRLGFTGSLRPIGLLAGLSALAIAGLITYGAWVRVSGSGLGCPDWPLCNGGVTPAGDRASAIEYGHRLLAGFTMLGVFASAFLAYQRRREVPLAALVISAAAMLIIIQAALGGAAVLAELPGSVVLAHLAMAMTILGLVTAGALIIAARELPLPTVSMPMRPMALLGAGVIMAGGSIVATGTGLGCLDLPFCDGGASTMSKWLHPFHRVLGAVLAGGVALLLWHLRRQGWPQPFTGLTWLLALLLTGQLVLGVVAVTESFPSSLRILHVGLATLIWWVLIAVWVLSALPPAEPGMRRR